MPYASATVCETKTKTNEEHFIIALRPHVMCIWLVRHGPPSLPPPTSPSSRFRPARLVYVACSMHRTFCSYPFRDREYSTKYPRMCG